MCVLTGDDVEKAERVVLRAFLQFFCFFLFFSMSYPSSSIKRQSFYSLSAFFPASFTFCFKFHYTSAVSCDGGTVGASDVDFSHMLFCMVDADDAP